MSRPNLNTVPHYNELYTSGRYDSVGKIRMDRIYKAHGYLAHVDKKEGRILDVGCGEGAAANYLAEQGYNTVGVDFSPIAIRSARAGYASGGPKEPERWFKNRGAFIEHDIRKGLPFKDEFFDAAVAFEILEHMEDPRALAQEIMRVLKDEGRLFFTCPKAEVSFDDPEHIQAFQKEDYAPLFAPYKLLILNDADWPRNIWGLVEKRE